MATRDEIVERVRADWPAYAAAVGKSVPPVREGGYTAALIDLAVDTALTALAEKLQCTCDYAGMPDEPHKVWCQGEHGAHAECSARVETLESEACRLREALTEARERSALLVHTATAVRKAWSEVAVWGAAEISQAFPALTDGIIALGPALREGS